MDPATERRDLVIKVKHGDALRRFTAYVNGNTLNHNMSSLKTKIIHLFKFGEDADLLFTYNDIDGDEVTLLTDEELYDAAIYQRLNPLRITVHLNENTSSNFPGNNGMNPPSGTMPGLQSSEIKTGLQSPGTIMGLEFLPSQLSHVVEESLRAVPVPLRNTLTKISEEVSKVTEFADFVAKLGQPQQVSTSGIPLTSQKNGNNSTNAVTPDLLDLNLASTINSLDLNPGIEQSKGKDTAVLKDVQEKEKSISFPTSAGSQLNIGSSSAVPVMHGPSANLGGSSKKQYQDTVPPSKFSDTCRLIDSAYTGGYNGSCCDRRGPFGRHGGMLKSFHSGVSCDGCGMQPIVGPRYKSKVQENYDLCSSCFSEIGNAVDYMQIDRPVYRPPRPGFAPRSMNHACCWGMQPPKGKLESRFIQDVTIPDGTLIAPSTEFTKIWRFRNNGFTSWPRGTHLVRIGGDVFADKSSVELEIPVVGFPPREEIDVAVDFCSPPMPGRYVSYWRLASPQGQKFGQRVWVLIQVESYGSGAASIFEFDLNPADTEETNTQTMLNVPDVQPSDVQSHVAVDVEPVNPSSDVTSGEDTGSLKFNFFDDAPPAANGPIMPQMEISVPYHVIDSRSVLSNSTGNPLPFMPYPVVDTVPVPSSAPPVADTGTPFPVIDPSKVSSSDLVVPVMSSGAPFPVIDSSNVSSSSLVVPVMPSGAPFPVIDSSKVSSSSLVVPLTPSGALLDDATEQALLRDLEEIGFKEMELNKKIMRRNDYDLEKTVDDLCSIAEWDPLLEGLDEMGFHDKETNIKLLAKNGGSLKRTVLDLIAQSD